MRGMVTIGDGQLADFRRLDGAPIEVLVVDDEPTLSGPASAGPDATRAGTCVPPATARARGAGRPASSAPTPSCST